MLQLDIWSSLTGLGPSESDSSPKSKPLLLSQCQFERQKSTKLFRETEITHDRPSVPVNVADMIIEIVHELYIPPADHSRMP